MKKYAGFQLAIGNYDGRIDSTGAVVWHKGNGNLAKYYPDTGKIENIKYNQSDFLKHAGLTKIGSGRNKGKYSKTNAPGWPNTWEEVIEALKEKGVALLKNYGQTQGYASFKTGGLANYTGPAWLDGTKTKPELVLNAQDTRNFIALRDTLSSLQGRSFTNQSNGDLNFDIDINVEKIDNDYDVKKVASMVKQEIVKSANYRNVNIVRNMK